MSSPRHSHGTIEALAQARPGGVGGAPSGGRQALRPGLGPSVRGAEAWCERLCCEPLEGAVAARRRGRVEFPRFPGAAVSALRRATRSAPRGTPMRTRCADAAPICGHAPASGRSSRTCSESRTPPAMSGSFCARCAGPAKAQRDGPESATKSASPTGSPKSGIAPTWRNAGVVALFGGHAARIHILSLGFGATKPFRQVLSFGPSECSEPPWSDAANGLRTAPSGQRHGKGQRSPRATTHRTASRA